MDAQLIQYVKNKKLFTEKETIIIALSGGVDSMVLLDVLSHIHPTNKLVIAHVNHKKRIESENEYIQLQKIAKKYNIRFEGYDYHHDDKSNFQASARKARYQFFFALAVKHNAKTIVTAHHLDDQIETIFMRIIRGSSFSGYSGMKHVINNRNYQIIRPFLDVPKDTLYDYAEKSNLIYFEDKSNEEDTYTRNRFRNQIIPLLKDENPAFYEKMEQFAHYMEDADDVLEVLAKKFMSKHYTYATIPLKPFQSLDQVIQIKVLEKAINKASDNTVEISYKQYQTLLEMVNSTQPNQFYSLGNDYEWIKEYDVFYIEKISRDYALNIEITSPGEYFIDDEQSFIFSFEKLEHYHRNYYELCYNEKVFPLYLRTRQNGDRIKLKDGTKKVKDVLIDKKIPMSRRNKLVLLTDNNIVYWIVNVKKGYQESHPNKLYIYEVNEC